MNLDSADGIAVFIEWARRNSMVLLEFHEGLAKKYGVSIEGVVIARPLPVGNHAMRELKRGVPSLSEVTVNDVSYDVDFRVTSYGSPPNMGSLTYPGDAGDPPEIEIDTVIPTDMTEGGDFEEPSQVIMERIEELILQEVTDGQHNPEPPEY